MIVVDTSVAFKWFNANEEGFDKALIILEYHLRKKNIILVPSLLFYEITNAWTTKSSLDEEKIKNNLKLLGKYSLETLNLDTASLQKSVHFAREYKTSVYDAVYAILAQERKCDLVTADQKFAERVCLPFIKTLQSYSPTSL